MSKAATTVTKTADNANSFLRFMSLSFRDLSFGRDTMDGTPEGRTADIIRGVTRGLEHGSAGKKRSHRSCLDCRGGRTAESSGTGGFEWPVETPAIRTKSQTDLAGNQCNCLYRSRSLSDLIGQSVGRRPPTFTLVPYTRSRPIR